MRLKPARSEPLALPTAALEVLTAAAGAKPPPPKVLDAFAAAGAEILGVSKDSVASHAKFAAKHDLKVRLGSDPSGQVTEAYGVWVEKNMYGRKYMGIERSTFLIGPDGRIAGLWRKVKVAGHAEAVLTAVRSLRP